MSSHRAAKLVLVTVLVACLLGPFAVPASAAPSAAQTQADRAALEKLVARYQEVQDRAADIDARVAAASAALDQAIAAEEQSQAQLQARAVAIYRSGQTDPVSVLLGATTFEDFVTRLEILDRIARRDAENLKALKDARAAARASAEELLELQADSARAVDELATEVAAAKKKLAASQAALAAYQARLSAGSNRTTTPAPSPGLTGSGEWRTGVASHYGINFTGRGANGESIGPYSMMVAHKTLPFGTLVEFEYNGRRAVAKVADRGPFVAGRDWDLGPGVVRALGFNGVHEVRYRIVSQ